MIKRISGTKDILPEEINLWRKIEETSRLIFSLYNYQEIRTPLVEEASLFNRSLGETTEIVQKQMFLIKNKEELYALRPEGTASIVRAYLENSLDKTESFMKFYYIGPMFRLERPQRGRLRQFHHIGCEAINCSDASIDVEIISLADNLLRNLSISGYKIKINSLGCLKDKKKLTEILAKALKNKAAKLCADCQRRLKYNILRILDCKNQGCIDLVRQLDINSEHLCVECLAHFAKVKNGLDTLKINYEVDSYLVRGLDYYNRTVFEIAHPELGAQDALGAGGRYDNLIKELGGPDTSAIGFAFGIERLLLVTKLPNHQATKQILVYLITLGEEAKSQGTILLNNLRQAGIACDTDYENKSLKGAMRAANTLKATHVLIIGEDEIKKGAVTIKDMETGEQKIIKHEDLIKELQEC